MAKSSGGAGRTEKSKGQSGLPREWLFTGLTGDEAIINISPDGEIYDVKKIVPDEDDPIHSEATQKIIGLLGRDKFPDGWYVAGWSDVRLWVIENARMKGGLQRTLQMQIPEGGRAGLRKAQRITDFLVSKGMKTQNLDIELGIGYDNDAWDFNQRWDGDYGTFMTANSWRDLG